MRGQRFSISEEAVDAFRMLVWRYLNQSGKSASKSGSNTCKSVQILMGNILKNNKGIFSNPEIIKGNPRMYGIITGSLNIFHVC